MRSLGKFTVNVISKFELLLVENVDVFLLFLFEFCISLQLLLFQSNFIYIFLVNLLLQLFLVVEYFLLLEVNLLWILTLEGQHPVETALLLLFPHHSLVSELQSLTSEIAAPQLLIFAVTVFSFAFLRSIISLFTYDSSD